MSWGWIIRYGAPSSTQETNGPLVRDQGSMERLFSVPRNRSHMEALYTNGPAAAAERRARHRSRRSTAAEVIVGVALIGKRAIVTGADSQC